ncbi:MAG: TIGR03087 family PEP-CTERM/XrtA system glycosyltransferase [Pseudomonadota bacterium]
MSGRREVLFLAHRIPYPPDKGDKIRSFRLMERLTSRYDVHLGCFVDDAADRRYEEDVRLRCASAFFAPLSPRAARLRGVRTFAGGRPITRGYYRDADMDAFVAQARRRPLAAEVVFSSSMAQYIEGPRPPGAPPRLVDLCDADSAKWAAYARRRRGAMSWVYAREARLLAAEERRIIAWADASFAISEAEAGVLSAGRPARRLHWFGNGVNANYFNPDTVYAAPDGAADIVFVGMMDYWANEDAVVWFVDKVWPKLRARAPAATFAIVGANPGSAVRALARTPGVSVTGRVADVRPWLAHARVVVAPLRIARGVQNKVREAMAMAKPVVATSGAAEGIAAVRDAELLVADAAGGFADEVASLLETPARADALGAAARARIAADYDWSRQLARFDRVLETLIDARATAGDLRAAS